MKNFKKFLSCICAASLCVSLFAACSEEEVIPSDAGYNEEEILSQYDAIIGSAAGDTPLDSGASVLGENFSQVDFTFTSADDTIAYSLDKNSFAKLTSEGTFFDYIAPGSEVETFEAGFKTARGLSLANTAGEFLSKYGITDSNGIYLNPADSVYYAPTAGVFAGKLTALFASDDSVSYYILPGSEVQKFLYERDVFTQGDYIDPVVITSKFPEYASVVAVDITADNTGAVSEVSFYRFDK